MLRILSTTPQSKIYSVPSQSLAIPFSDPNPVPACPPRLQRSAARFGLFPKAKPTPNQLKTADPPSSASVLKLDQSARLSALFVDLRSPAGGPLWAELAYLLYPK